MGGAFYIDDQYKKHTKSLQELNLSNGKPKLRPGDDIYRNNTGYVLQAGFLLKQNIA